MRALALTASLLLATGCGLLGLDGRCGDETREVSATTRFVEPGDPQAGYTQFDVVEHRHDEPRESMSWFLFSAALHGHIQRARLVGLPEQATLLELPVEPGLAGEAMRGSLAPYAGATPFRTLFARMRANEVALEIETDLPGRERLRQLLGVVRFSDWSQPYCS